MLFLRKASSWVIECGYRQSMLWNKLTPTFQNTVTCRNVSTSTFLLTRKDAITLRVQNTNLMDRKKFRVSDEFIQKQIEKFKLSKRRLANMMGENPDSYNDRDVDRAIKYLFPSDLDNDSLPRLKHPSEIFKSRLKVECDADGKPFHYLHYTLKPTFYELMHQIYQQVLDLRKIKKMPDEKEELNLAASRWITKEELIENILDGEIINDFNYNQFLAQTEQLLREPHIYNVKDFIMKFRIDLPVVTMLGDVKEVMTLEDGRSFVEEEGRKKTAIAQVKLISPGTGLITVNKKPFLKYFDWLDDRQTVISPFCFLGNLLKFDVEATVEGATWTAYGMKDPNKVHNKHLRKAAKATAIRAGISRAMRSFITEEEVEQLRRCGFLTHDKRMKERKLPGQWKARKKFTWKRR